MWLNNIKGSIEIKGNNSLGAITDKTVKRLQDRKFFTEKNDKTITFQRAIQFTENSGKNRWKIFLFSYNGLIEISERNGRVVNDFELNINAQLFKLLFLFFFTILFLYLFEVEVNQFLLFGFSLFLILIQRILIHNHFYKTISLIA